MRRAYRVSLALGGSALAVAAATLPPLAGGCSARGGAPGSAGAPPAADAAAGAPAASPVGSLATAPVTRALGAGEGHGYRLDLAAGDYAHVVVEQLGADAAVALYDPAGELRITIDTPTFTGADGDEHLHLRAEAAGVHRLEVRAIEDRGPGSGYRARLVARRPATAADLRRVRAEELYHRGLARRVERDWAAAAPLFTAAVEAFGALGDESRRADAEAEQCLALRALERFGEARAACARALAVYRRLGPTWRRATTLHLLGEVDLDDGDPGRALEQFRRALPLKRELGDPWNLALLLDDLGAACRELRAYHDALTDFGEALAIWRSLGETGRAANALHARGQIYLELGKPEQAAGDFRTALELPGRGERDRAATLAALGLALIEAGQPQAAPEPLAAALAIWTRIGDRSGTAFTLITLGVARASTGRPAEAVRLYRRALPLAEAAGDRELVGHIFHNLAWLEVDGDPARAVRLFRRALDEYRRGGNRQAEVRTLLGLARAERARGRPETGLGHLELALLIVGDLRDRLDRPDLQVTYLARRYDVYDTGVDLLMDLHRRYPGQGWDARALEMSERARGRGLLDLLNELGIEPRGGAGPELLERERELRARLHAAEARRRRLREAGGAGGAQLAAAERELEERSDELRNLRAAIRRASPAYAALAEPELLGAAAIQSRLLDADTVLLEYKLGAERSYLWAVGRDRLESFELAGRAELARLALDLHREVGRPPRLAGATALERSLAELSRALLCPARDWLGRRRLIVVAEGELLYVPFAALSAGHCGAEAAAGAGGGPLAAGHEIVTAPSASILAALRRRPPRPPPPLTLAVIANPVFSRCDPRVPAAYRGDECPSAPPRLRYSGEEADSILALVPPAERVAAVGFDARRTALLDGALGGARYVHIATHIETREGPPRLVLSRVDARGDPLEDGDLLARELDELRLSADLVVLSGCDSGLGEPIRGEGLVGLAQAFLQAGAGGVLVSLWPVDDRAAASLMARFYRVLLQEDLSPAAALARAQAEIAGQPRWRSPFYWAGFVLLGEGEPSGGGGGQVARLAR